MIDFCFGLRVTKCATWAKCANFPAGALQCWLKCVKCGELELDWRWEVMEGEGDDS